MMHQGLTERQKIFHANNSSMANYKIKKSITGIHCKPANKVTFVQWKLMNVCLYHAYSDLTTVSHHRVNIDALNKYFAYSGNNFQLFNEAFKGLQTVLFTWNAFGELIEANEKEPWIRVAFLSEVIWDSSAREFIYAFGKGVPEQFYIPKYYASFLLEMQNKFSSAFALRIYEIGMRYINAPKGSRRYSITDLKELLAVQKNEYKDFKYFNRGLKRAVSEVNKISDINISIDYIKERRKIAVIKFYVMRKSEVKTMEEGAAISNMGQDKSELRQIMLEEFGWQPVESIDSFLEEYTSDELFTAIEYVRNTDFYKNYKNGIVQGNLGAYLRKAVVDSYKSKKFEDDKKRQEKEKLANLQYIATRLINQYKEWCKNITDTALDAVFKQNAESDLYDIFESECDNIVKESCEFAQTMALGKKRIHYRETGLYRSKFRNYLIDKYQLRQQLLDFDEFIKDLQNTKTFYDWHEITKKIEQGVLSIELPNKATMTL